MRKLFRIQGAIFSLSIRRTLAFRTDLVFQVVNIIVSITLLVLSTLVVYLQVPLIGGWNFNEALVLTGVYAVIAGIRNTLIVPSVEEFASSVRDGSLDVQLLRPVPSWFAVSLHTHRPMYLLQSAFGVGLLLAGLSRSQRWPSLSDGILGCVLVAMAVVISWSVSVTVACFALFSARLDFSPVIWALWELGRYPAAIYGTTLRVVLTYLVPLAGMVTLPAEALVFAGSVRGLIALSIGVLISIGTTFLVFSTGMRRYTGATS